MDAKTEIDPSEEFSTDWDWYACDKDGNIGHFTTAGLRSLPNAVKKDRVAAERLITFFFKETANRGNYSVRDAAETDAGGWRSSEARERFLKSFADMARKGVFSFNTDMVHGHGARYYLVAKPERPLQVTDLPPEIGALVSQLRAPLSFAKTEYIREADTLNW